MSADEQPDEALDDAEDDAPEADASEADARQADASESGSEGGADERGPPDLLKPARPDAHGSERAPWAPRIPWKWIVVVVVGLGAIFSSYYVRRDQRKEALREQMLTLHERELSELAERYLEFRQGIEGRVMDAAEDGEPETWVHPQLNLAGLREADGLYLRVPADFTDSPSRIEGAALAMGRDAITRCLGLEPMSARGLYEAGHFLTPEWVDLVRTEDDMMELRVLDDQLGRHVQVDAPVVITMMQAEWFMLVVQQGESRRSAPVDVYLWDLRRDQLLLRARIQGRGLLVPVRIAIHGVNNPDAPARPRMQSGAANDCSIASQIRELTGHEGVEFESSDALLEAAAADEAAEAAEASSEDGEPGEGSDETQDAAETEAPPDTEAETEAPEGVAPEAADAPDTDEAAEPSEAEPEAP